jgi:hypothetical protein
MDFRVGVFFHRLTVERATGKRRAISAEDVPWAMRSSATVFKCVFVMLCDLELVAKSLGGAFVTGGTLWKDLEDLEGV